MQMKKRVKGFTLMELIVVLAIIGILAAILAPTMTSYYRMSRLKDVNSDARMVFNAAQTEMQKRTNIDRIEGASSTFAGTVIVYYNENGTIFTSSAGLNSGLVNVAGTPDEQMYRDFVEAVNKVVSEGEEISWAVCIEEYVVKGCMSSDNVTSSYVGRASANKADGTRPEATERDAQTFGQLMATGTALANFTDEFYDLTGYPTGP